MFCKKTYLALAAYFVLTMGLAYPWHMIWFHDIYVKLGAFQREEPIMPLGILAILVQGLVISSSFPKTYPGQRTILVGVKHSLALGLLVYTATGFATAAKFNIDPVSTFLIYHTIFQLLQFAIFGVALGFIFRNDAPQENGRER